MSLVCQCPAATYLTSIPKVTCPVNFGQLQKVIFQRLINSSTGLKNSIAGSGTPLAAQIGVKATWTPLLAANDDTKVVVSPFINNPTEGGGDARMSSGGNDDLGGIPEVLGGNPVTFEGSIRAVPQEVIRAMKELQCEANVGNLGVYLIDENGNIAGIQDEVAPTTYYPIPIRALFIGSLIHGNYDAKDSNLISWQYPDNYSDYLGFEAPAAGFNPLTDL